MFAKPFSLAMATTALIFMTAPALSQSVTSHQAGLEVARKRGVSNPSCYASVFAKHAVIVENANGRRNWSAASTPAYNAEMRQRCGVDRLALSRQQDAPSVHSRQSTTTSGHSNAGAYRAGLATANRQGYTNPDCYARVFAQHAYPTASLGRDGVWYSVNRGPAFQNAVRTQCGI